MAGRGPLPTGEAARRHAPTIPTTQLPVSGRKEPAPDSPRELGHAGAAWWSSAWATPQAAGWSIGDLPFIARRASLEDEPEMNPTWHRVMNDMDDRLGLTPKGLAALRWKIVPDEEPAKAAGTAGSGRKNLTLVDKVG